MKKGVTLLCSSALLAGCATSFNIVQHTPSENSGGMVYALPRTAAAVEIQYKVTSSRVLRENEYLPRVMPELTGVRVVTRTEPDPKAYFAIDLNPTDASRWKGTFAAAMNENLSLSSVSVSDRGHGDGGGRECVAVDRFVAGGWW